MTAKLKPLTAKLEVFAQHWARTDNKASAYREMLPNSRAKSTSIYEGATRTSLKPQVLARYLELKEINKKVADKAYGITEQRVLGEIARLAFNNPKNCFDPDGNLLPIKDWPDAVAATIASIKVVERRSDDDVTTQIKEIKFWDKGRQIELAAKTLGMLVDKKEVKVEGEITEIQRVIVDEA